MSHRVIIARPVPKPVADRAAAELSAQIPSEPTRTTDQVLQALADNQAEGLFFSGYLKMDAATIARLPPSVKVAATCSVGFDHIDVAAAKARGLVVTNTPEVLTDCTADLAFTLLLNACRRINEFSAVMRDGWGKPTAILGTQASNKTLGIVGLGRIGRAMARRARGFNIKVLYTDLHRIDPAKEEGAEYVPTLEALLPRCGIVTLHAPGGAATDRLINARTLALMPKGSVLVNAARGTLVDEDALIEALRSGHLFAAGLDVFRTEPNYDQRFRELPNVFLTPHIGSATAETRVAMGHRALDNIAAVLAGKPAVDPLWQ